VAGDLTNTERRSAEIALVECCEEIMARENGAWRAEWLSEERGRAAVEAFAKAQGSAKGGAGKHDQGAEE
jgi:hypothetical protein